MANVNPRGPISLWILVATLLLVLPSTSFAPGVPGQGYGTYFTHDESLLHRIDQIWTIQNNALTALVQSDKAIGLWDPIYYYTPPSGFELASFEIDNSRSNAVVLIVRQDPDNRLFGTVEIDVLKLDLKTRAQTPLFKTGGTYNTGVPIVSDIHLGSTGAVAVETELRSQERCRVYLPDGSVTFDDDLTWVERFSGFSLDGRYAFGIIDGDGEQRPAYLRRVDLESGEVKTFTFPRANELSYLTHHQAVVILRSSLKRKEFRVVKIPEMDDLTSKNVEGFAAILEGFDRRLPLYALTENALLGWERGSSISLPEGGVKLQLLAEHPTKYGYIYLKRDVREVFGFTMGREDSEPQSMRLFALENGDPANASGSMLLIEEANSLFWGELGFLQLISRQSNRLFLLDLGKSKYYEVPIVLPERKQTPWYHLDRKAVVFFR